MYISPQISAFVRPEMDYGLKVTLTWLQIYRHPLLSVWCVKVMMLLKIDDSFNVKKRM